MHVIRLRRPWHKSDHHGGTSARVDVPEADVDHEHEERTFRYQRNFNLPSGLRASSQVFLRIDGWQGRLESAAVNGFPLPIEHSRIDAEITQLLEPHNQITLLLTGLPGQGARLSGEVTLAIDAGSP